MTEREKERRRHRYATDPVYRQKCLDRERKRFLSESYKQKRRKRYAEDQTFRQKKVDQQNAYAVLNRDKEASRARAWRRANPEKQRALNVAYGLANREKIAVQKKAYALANPEIVRNNSHKRKARLRGANKLTLTKQQWLDRLEEFGHHCAYCWTFGVELTQDHLIPISKGGSHSYDNVVPACLPCNMRKRTRSMMEVLRLIS